MGFGIEMKALRVHHRGTLTLADVVDGEDPRYTFDRRTYGTVPTPTEEHNSTHRDADLASGGDVGDDDDDNDEGGDDDTDGEEDNEPEDESSSDSDGDYLDDDNNDEDESDDDGEEGNDDDGS